jgi:hypothetical protein
MENRQYGHSGSPTEESSHLHGKSKEKLLLPATFVAEKEEQKMCQM